MTFARVRALVIVGVLLVGAMVVVGMALAKDSQSAQPGAADCPPGWTVVNLDLPEPKQVKLRVFNGTSASGLGEQVADGFRNRHFQVKKVGKAKATDEIAVLRFGPKAYGAGHLMRAYFLDKAVVAYDPKRKDDLVDVIVGTRFQQIGTTTDVNQSLAELGSPQLPEASCAAHS